MVVKTWTDRLRSPLNAVLSLEKQRDGGVPPLSLPSDSASRIGERPSACVGFQRDDRNGDVLLDSGKAR